MTNTDVFELGIFETLKNVFKYSKDETLLDECSRVIPIPDFLKPERIKDVATKICELNEKNIIFLTPEILVFDELVKVKCNKNIYVCLPLSISDESSVCIKRNMPRKLGIKVISEENIYSFSMNDTAIVVCGFEDEYERALVLNRNYQLLQKFKSFYGKKILISAGTDRGARLPGWKTIYREDYFNATA